MAQQSTNETKLNRASPAGHELAPIDDGPTISIAIVQQESHNLTTTGYINGDKRVLTLDTGASKSIVRSDLVKGKITQLNGVRLRTATGEPAAVHGKITLRLTIANKSENYEFIVADIVDEVIIGADFMIAFGINLDMKERVMTWSNVEIPLNVGYDESTPIRRLTTNHPEIIPPCAEAIIWVPMNGDCGAEKLWVVEPAENRNTEAVVNLETSTEKPAAMEKKHLDGYIKEWTHQLSPSERNKAKQLLRKYASTFALTKEHQGRTSVVKHEINTADARPIKQPPRSVPLAKRDEVQKLISEMEKSGYYAPSIRQ
ncbi:uncharacterized protein LOC131802038 [Musca domestica]|uniref:Uncharacterized protein LOC131802038 n=1 Tax=Musca domestica TaxID=7370 RepID=A0ABM3UV07_MUSDO|nr:uncharacterized protein LOC131802038 [Musca domestica]